MTQAKESQSPFLSRCIQIVQRFFHIQRTRKTQAPTGDLSTDLSESSLSKSSLFRIGDLIGGTLRVESVLSGGMGIVYICRHLTREEATRTPGAIESFYGSDLQTPRTVVDTQPSRKAIKSFYPKFLWRPEIVSRFNREAYIWISLPPHPNVVRAWTFMPHAGPLLYLEYIDGGTLRTRLRGQPLSENEVIRIALQFCVGMRFLFETAGIVHRDIKPENILLTRLGNVKITDFGLAKAFTFPEQRSPVGDTTNSLSEDAVKTQRGVIFGSLPYMSPEQYADPHEVTTTSDVYSFGVVLYEMLTGRLPLEARSYLEWRRKHLEEPPKPPFSILNVSQELSAIAMKCLEKPPDRRYRDFAELGGTLEAYARATGASNLIPPAPLLSELESKMSDSDWSARGVAFRQLGEYQRACDCYRRALDIDPAGMGVNLNMAAALAHLGRLEEALAHAEKEVQLHPDFALAYDALSQAYVLAKRIPEAFTACRKAAELAPDHVELWRKYAIAAYGVGSKNDYERAITGVLNILLRDPLWFSVTKEAIHFAQAGDFEGALALHALSVERSPTIAFNWYNYGVTLHRLGKIDEAFNCYSRAIQVDKGCTLAWVNRGWIHAERRQRSEAEKDWRSAIRADPDHVASRAVATFLEIGTAQEFEKGQLEQFPLNYSF